MVALFGQIKLRRDTTRSVSSIVQQPNRLPPPLHFHAAALSRVRYPLLGLGRLLLLLRPLLAHTLMERSRV